MTRNGSAGDSAEALDDAAVARLGGRMDAYRYLRLSEVAEIVGIARSTAYEWAHAGRLPVIHRPGGMYVPAAALEAFLAAEAEEALDNLKEGPTTRRAGKR